MKVSPSAERAPASESDELEHLGGWTPYRLYDTDHTASVL